MKIANIRKMTATALLMALVIVLQLVGGMIPPVSGFSISLVLIPVIMGSALYGPKTGMLLGGVFGAVVVVNCITGVDGGGAMVFQANPVLCILVVMAKGILAGLASGLVYRLLHNTNTYIAMLAAAIICPVVNTGVFVLCMLTFFQDVLTVWADGGEIMAYVLSGLVLCNFVPELLINVVFSPAGQTILRVFHKK